MDYPDSTDDWGKNNLDFAEIAQSGEELLRLVREWRERLGTKCGTLDNYLAGVLNAMFNTANTRDATDKGFGEGLSPLRGILRHIKNGEEAEAQKHPFYPKVRMYMDTHPFPQDLLYYETYCAGLFREYVMFAVKGYMRRCGGKFQAELEENNIPKLRDSLLASGASITVDSLDYLNNLISQVFIWIAPPAIFMQGLADQIMLSLILRDKESGRIVFQRILDGEV